MSSGYRPHGFVDAQTQSTIHETVLRCAFNALISPDSSTSLNVKWL